VKFKFSIFSTHNQFLVAMEAGTSSPLRWMGT